MCVCVCVCVCVFVCVCYLPKSTGPAEDTYYISTMI